MKEKHHKTWVKQFQLFLLDFDGLLVNSEELHYLAYLKMCENRDLKLGWSFDRFKKSAHHSTQKLRADIFIDLPALKDQEPDWEILYAEKKRVYLELLHEKPVQLMPGVETFLESLNEYHLKSCVVTNSPLEQIDLIRSKQPKLDLVTHWITRENYSQAKPNPECYLKAIELYASKDDKIVGFEDSPRGTRALLGTKASVVVISEEIPLDLEKEIQEGKVHFFKSFNEIDETNLKP